MGKIYSVNKHYHWDGDATLHCIVEWPDGDGNRFYGDIEFEILNFNHYAKCRISFSSIPLTSRTIHLWDYDRFEDVIQKLEESNSGREAYAALLDSQNDVLNRIVSELDKFIEGPTIRDDIITTLD